jgi:triacylglycerol esterase/lipase EstA (alpha/beta hydrolase family)
VRYLLYILLVITLSIPNSAAALEGQKGDYVVLLHGIARSSSHMKSLEKHLQAHGYEVINIDYPSTQHSLEGLVAIISAELSKKLTEDKPVHFVGYSMGGLLIRAIINKKRPQNLGRVVQLAPPNNGSEVSDFFKNNWLYKKFYGPAGQQLTTDQKILQSC